MFSHYANVIDELEGKYPVPAEEQIRLAREATEQIPRRALDESLVHLIDHPTFTIHLPSGDELQIEEGSGASDQF